MKPTYAELLRIEIDKLSVAFAKEHGPPCEKCSGTGKYLISDLCWGDTLWSCDECEETGFKS